MRLVRRLPGRQFVDRMKTFLLGYLALAVSTGAAAEKIRVLIIDGQNNHNWKMISPVLKQILEQPQIFSIDVATSPETGKGVEKWSPNFSEYAVVVSNYNGEPWSSVTQEAFEKYVRGGGGFVPVHAANNAFPEWSAYNQMIGVGGWGGRNERSGHISDGARVSGSSTRRPDPAGATESSMNSS